MICGIITVSNDTHREGVALNKDTTARIEFWSDVKAYIQNLRYALQSGAKIRFQAQRMVDDAKEEKYRNAYAVSELFPDEDPVTALKRELMSLTVGNYIRTVKDLRFPNKSEMREFGKTYNGNEDVYIKIRVELLGQYGNHTVFIMSFHFAQCPFTLDTFPYNNNR